nr:MAG TPA: hypothetical protein [Bacteriophage sp.]
MERQGKMRRFTAPAAVVAGMPPVRRPVVTLVLVELAIKVLSISACQLNK